MPALRSLVLAVFLFSVMAGLSLLARSQNANPTTTTLRVTSNLVFLDVNVIDRKGRPVVTGLSKDDFAITGTASRSVYFPSTHQLPAPRW